MLLADDRFVKAYHEQTERRPMQMDAWLDEMVQEMLRNPQPLDLIVKISKFSLEKVAEIGKLHGLL